MEERRLIFSEGDRVIVRGMTDGKMFVNEPGTITYDCYDELFCQIVILKLLLTLGIMVGETVIVNGLAKRVQSFLSPKKMILVRRTSASLLINCLKNKI